MTESDPVVLSDGTVSTVPIPVQFDDVTADLVYYKAVKRIMRASPSGWEPTPFGRVDGRVVCPTPIYDKPSVH